LSAFFVDIFDWLRGLSAPKTGTTQKAAVSVQKYLKTVA
jgi:hypothetical protein